MSNSVFVVSELVYDDLGGHHWLPHAHFLKKEEAEAEAADLQRQYPYGGRGNGHGKFAESFASSHHYGGAGRIEVKEYPLQ